MTDSLRKDLVRLVADSRGFAPVLFVLLWWLNDLRVQWTALPDYSFGWVVLMLVGFLVYDRWNDRPAEIKPVPDWVTVCLAAFGTPLVIFAELYKHAVAPTPATSFVLSVGCAIFTCSLVCGYWGWAMLKHFSFSLAFLFVAVPLPGLIWSPIVTTLQALITTLNVEALALMGIPARQTGTVIQLPFCSVGVDEACSGVRSIQSSVMMALFLGYHILAGWPKRLSLVVAGVCWAITGNFLRSFYLSLTAHSEGVAALEGVHDQAGWAVLGFTAIGIVVTAWGIKGQDTDSRNRNAN